MARASEVRLGKGARMNLLDSLTARATSNPRQVALHVDGLQITYGDLDLATRRVSAALRADDIAAGSRVAYLGRSSLEYYLLVIGSMRAGAVAVPLNWRCTVHELAPTVADARPGVLVVDVEYADFVDDLAAAADGNIRVVTVGGTPEAMNLNVPGSLEWTAWLDVEPASQTAKPDVTETVLQMYTSGTTGRPKGVMSSESSLNAYLHVMADAAGLAGDAVSLSALPHFHIGGTCWTLAGLLAGSTVIVTRDSQPASLLRIVRDRGVTHLLAVPTLIQRLAEENERTSEICDSIKTFYYGGSTVTESVLKHAFGQFRCDFVQGYGLTECSLVSVLERHDHAKPELLSSCGKPLPGSQVRLVDPLTLADVEQGHVGEIWVQSPLRMKGYWNQPAAMREAVVDDWLRTGDMAYQDANGFLFLRDRLKDVIITGGENVFSAEVENVLMSHRGIDDCAVIGLPSQKWNETVVAVVVARQDDLAVADIIGYCRERLARYKCPTTVLFVRDLPRNPSGKVLKGALRARYADALGREAGGTEFGVG